MRYFYVDTENVGDYSFINDMEVTKEDTLVLFLSENSRRVKLEDVRLISESGAKVVYEDVYTGDSNALDFQLIALLSLNIATLPDVIEHVIVSDDNDYKIPVKYLIDKTGKKITILKTKDRALSVVDRLAITEALSDDVEEICGDITFFKEDILNLVEQCKALNVLHNKLRDKFGNEQGRDLYVKLKPHLKPLYSSR